MADPFISRQDLTEYLGRDVTADYGALAAADAACEVVRTLSEQTFNVVTGDTIVLDGSGTDALLLPELPVNAAGTVEVSGTAVTDFTVSDDGVLLRTNGSAGTWPAGRQNVAVTYDHGYADADLPRDVRMVALTIASRLIVQGVAQFEVLGSQQIRYGTNSTDLTAGEMAILRKYKRSR